MFLMYGLAVEVAPIQYLCKKPFLSCNLLSRLSSSPRGPHLVFKNGDPPENTLVPYHDLKAAKILDALHLSRFDLRRLTSHIIRINTLTYLVSEGGF